MRSPSFVTCADGDETRAPRMVTLVPESTRRTSHRTHSNAQVRDRQRPGLRRDGEHGRGSLSGSDVFPKGVLSDSTRSDFRPRAHGWPAFPRFKGWTWVYRRTDGAFRAPAAPARYASRNESDGPTTTARDRALQRADAPFDISVGPPKPTPPTTPTSARPSIRAPRPTPSPATPPEAGSAAEPPYQADQVTDRKPQGPAEIPSRLPLPAPDPPSLSSDHL